jgi:hypothetical protein
MTLNRQGPQPPVHPPLAGGSALVPVNLKPLTASSFNSGESFIFRNDSAGLGIPRGNFSNLNWFSHQAQHHGSVNTASYFPSSSGAVGERPGGAESSSVPGYGRSSASGAPSLSDASMGARSAGAPISGVTSGPVTAAPSAGGHPR